MVHFILQEANIKKFLANKCNHNHEIHYTFILPTIPCNNGGSGKFIPQIIMKLIPRLFLFGCFIIELLLAIPLHPQTKWDASLNKKAIINCTNAITSWQLKHPTKVSLTAWEYGTFYTGLTAFYKSTGIKQHLDSTIAMGNRVQWEPIPRPYDANTLGISQAFFDVFEFKKDNRMIDKSRYIMDMTLARRLKPETNFKENKYWWEWWTWCDALFMAPAAYARMSKLSGDDRYIKYMDKMWWLASDYLYSKTDSLYFRDDRFFTKASEHGNKIFWSRGNGWVVGGLCNVLQYLPKTHPSRRKYEEQFVEMCYKITSLQLKQGYWSPSLLDKEKSPIMETSGTAFFCYAFAWGINNGLLPEEDFMPSTQKAWASMVAAIQDDGMLGYVQRVGDQPDSVSMKDTEAYGAGAFLLAASELIKLDAVKKGQQF